MENWQKNAKNFLLSRAVFIEIFHVLTISLLSLLLPLSLLLLARLSSYNYLLAIASDSDSNPLVSPNFLVSLLLYINPAVFYPLISLITIAALIHGLTGKITILSESSSEIYHPCLYAAWILLCTVQVCVGLGIEGSIAAGIDRSSFDTAERSVLSRAVFFLGLHETVLHWCRTVVKPVVDDTVFGGAREERWVQKVAAAASFGGLWWWRLRDEVEALVIVAEVKIELLGTADAADLVGCWLYYLMVTIGMASPLSCPPSPPQ